MIFNKRSNFYILFFFILIYVFLISICNAREKKYLNITPYNKREAFFKEICNKNKNFKLIELGKTRKDKRTIYAIEIKEPSDNKNKIRVMFIGQVHGNEPAGGKALNLFMEKLAIKDLDVRKYLKYFDIYIIPCLNPEGSVRALNYYYKTGGFWGRYGRYNGDGYDINRDYIALNTQEARQAVKFFNYVKPQVVFDLHEFSTIPIIVAGNGWWRGANFDLLATGGRYPDIYPPLRKISRKILERTLFPKLKYRGVRTGYYVLSNGHFGPTNYMGTSATDYFNIRNAMVFLIETAGYDLGEKNIKKRIKLQLTAIEILLNEIIRQKNRIIRITQEAIEYSKNIKNITLKVKNRPKLVDLNNKKSDTFHFNSWVYINGKRYGSPVDVKFTDADYKKRMVSEIPPYYIVATYDFNFIKKLLIHCIKVYKTENEIKTQGGIVPKGVYIIPTKQEASVIIGVLFNKDFQKKSRYIIKEKFIVKASKGPFNLKKLKEIKIIDEI